MRNELRAAKQKNRTAMLSLGYRVIYKKMKKEFCIMPKDRRWKTERFLGSERHECIFGIANRKKSIEDGLVIFLTHEQHNEPPAGIHYDKDFRKYSERVAEEAWIKYYHKTKEEFLKRYGKNYL